MAADSEENLRRSIPRSPTRRPRSPALTYDVRGRWIQRPSRVVCQTSDDIGRRAFVLLDRLFGPAGEGDPRLERVECETTFVELRCPWCREK